MLRTCKLCHPKFVFHRYKMFYPLCMDSHMTYGFVDESYVSVCQTFLSRVQQLFVLSMQRISVQKDDEYNMIHRNDEVLQPSENICHIFDRHVTMFLLICSIHLASVCISEKCGFFQFLENSKLLNFNKIFTS